MSGPVTVSVLRPFDSERKRQTMARARKTAGTRTSDQTTDNPLTCPECGKTFSRPASLGAHRNRAHGVAGTSTKRRRGTRARSGIQTPRRQSGGRPGRAGSSNGQSGRISRDALLQTVFPTGVPAREEVIRRANAWLDEAEELASTR